jgi:dihydrofolate reductase
MTSPSTPPTEPMHDTPAIAAAPSTEGAGTSAAPPLAVIAAVAANGVIGSDNRLPWRLADDLKRFRALTTGHAVIMGRRTWESLGRALPGRQNIVVTRRHGFAAPGAETAASLDEALARVRLPGPAFCIGGAELYAEALARAGILYLTEIARDFPGDAFFPAFDRAAWREAEREPGVVPGPDGFAYAYVTYLRSPRR